MKVYTGTGDQGKTSLFSGERILKNDARIEAYGVVDELNAVVGALMAFLPDFARIDEVKAQLIQIQSDLFHVGAWLATTPESSASGRLTSLTAGHGQRLEKQMDALMASLKDLKAFIMPGGHPSAAWAHMARTVCRRAERRTVSLAASQSDTSDQTEHILVYLNRLSDYFFVLSRWCNNLAGIEDIIWQE